MQRGRPPGVTWTVRLREHREARGLYGEACQETMRGLEKEKTMPQPQCGLLRSTRS